MAVKNIYIIYNPKSTGSSYQNALKLKKQLASVNLTASLISTKRPAHARELAQQYAGDDTIIISSSGDGGFNEIINGVLTSTYPETVVSVLPSGNANDHHSERSDGDIVDRIKNSDIKAYDVLRVSWSNNVHYAHSYTGLGLSAVIGKELTKHDLNPLLEAWLVVRNLIKRRPVQIKIDGQTRRYDSFVCSIIGRMAKYLNLPDDQQRPAGKFTITRRRTGSLSSLLRHFFHLSIRPADDAPHASSLTLTTLNKLPMQLDGEIIELPAKTDVTIECLPGALKTII